MRLAQVFFVTLTLMIPALANALETKTETADALTVVFETEGPYVEDKAGHAFALPSGETVVDMSQEDVARLTDFLRKECTKTSGCELTVEKETKAVVAVNAPSGKTIAPSYGLRKKIILTGTPVQVETTLTGWLPDTYALTAQTKAGEFCVLNDYGYGDYYKAAYAFLESVGEAGTECKTDVVIVYYPPRSGEEIYGACKGYLATIKRK